MNDRSPEIDGKLRQYNRLLLSYADFKHAKLASAYILKEDLHGKYPQESYIILEALNCSMIVAYCRPFSGNNSNTPDLPKRLLRILDPPEKELHKVILDDRNKVFAHSDKEFLNLEAVRWQVAEQEVIVPLFNWGLAPLIEEATVMFNSMAEKLLMATMEERNRIEPELTQYLRLVDSENIFE